eukprot:5925029-Amphidinium_carterae.1
MKPICALLLSYLHRAGDAWRTEEDVRVVKNLEASMGRPGARKTPLLQYVSLVAERQCLHDLQNMAGNDNIWRWMPKPAWHLQHQALAFRVISRLGALIYELLMVPTFSCPFQLFKLLEDPSHAPVVLLHQHDCQLQEFSREFFTAFGDDITSKEALACLEAVAYL